MDRRTFSLTGLGATFATLVGSTHGQTSPTPATPTNLEEMFPSSTPAPAPCFDLPEFPAPPSDAVSQKLFPGFKTQYLKTSGATICVLTKGQGQPLLLIHGDPETHVTWHKIAPQLAEEYSVVLVDLRGYGDSSKPPGGPRSENYSFRTMAKDQVAVMRQLGHTKFMVAGHDRGGRVAARLCQDYPDLVQKVALLGIAPTLTMYTGTNQLFATKYYWWFLFVQAAPMPEHLIGLNPSYFLRDNLKATCKTPGALTPDAVGEYMRCYCCKSTIRAICEDYRAAAGIDLDEDRESENRGQNIKCPVLTMSGTESAVSELWDVTQAWRSQSDNLVTSKYLHCGHFLQEEQPQAVLAEFQTFFHS